MPKALKEEYLPANWKQWIKTDPSHRLREAGAIETPVDVIAVQGLASTYEWTWSKDVGNGRSVMWLRDLLGDDLTNARILSFEYDSKWLDDPAMVALEDCGERLLESIIWDRTHRGSRECREMCPIMAKRPMILLGHSYGGLVIKQALVTAATAPKNHPRYNDYQSLITAVSGVIFLGTPHNGSSFASAGIFQASFRAWFGHATNIQILKPLALNTTMTELKDLEESFQKIRSYDRLSALESFYFYETKPLKAGPFETKLVVAKESACFGSHKSVQVPLDANHMELNKFSNRNESNYQRIIEKLRGLYATARSTVRYRWGRYQYDTQHPGGVVKEIKHWLSPENVFNDDYLTRRAEQLEGTCEWIHRVDVITDWLRSSPDSRTDRLDPKGSVLITGKAGSGKSVLAAYLHSILAERLRNENWSANDFSRCSGFAETKDCQHYTVTGNKAVLYFPVSRSSRPDSVIRTLIDQLLYFQPTNSGLQSIVQSEFIKGNIRECTSVAGIGILQKLLKKFPSVHIILDGLEECDQPEVIIQLMVNVCRIDSVKLMLLIRQDQELHQMFDLSSKAGHRLNYAKLDVAHHNADDIEKFITKQLLILAESNDYVSQDADSIRQSISERALGMFQWVKLILHELRFAQSQDDVHRCLDRFPRELNKAYSKTFKRLIQTTGFDKDNAILVLKLLLAAYRPLKWLDLAVAFQLHQELRKDPELDVRSLGEIVEKAVQKAHRLPDSYFAFLGPLVDLRSTTDIVDVTKWHTTTDRRMTRTLVICHHSLTQWIEGTTSAVEMSSGYWQEFHFSRREAHKPLALLCLVMVSSRSRLSTYLRDIYSPKGTTSPFLNYAGEYWPFHLRAVGGESSTGFHKRMQYRDGVTRNLVLTDFAGATLEHSIDVTCAILLALSISAKSINSQEVGSLSKMIALRNLMTSLFSATRAIEQLKLSLPDTSRTLRELRNSMEFPNDSYNSSVPFDTTTTTLGVNLDSESMLRVLATLRTRAYPTSLLQWQQQRRREKHIQNLCLTSRALRQLSILLAVDPLRTWINSQTGDSGVSPIISLAHTSEAIDTYLAASLLPPELFSRYDFRDQFNSEHKHPQYGLIVAACRELSRQNDSSLDPTFYKEHVMKHYRISVWDWTITRLLIASLQMSPDDPSDMDHAIKYWLASNYLWPKNPSNIEWVSAFQIMSWLPFQSMTRNVQKTKRLISTLSRAGAVFCFKYLVQTAPLLEHVFISAAMNWMLWYRFWKPTLGLLSQNWSDFVIAFVLYILRCRYSPWLFGTLQVASWNSIWGPIFDIQGIVADPRGYVHPFTPSKWPWVTFFYYLVQELTIWYSSIFDVFGYMSEGTSLDKGPKSSLRRTTFHPHWANRNTHGYWQGLWIAFASRGLAILVIFRRLLFIERLLFIPVLWIYDLTKAAAQLFQSSPLQWKKMLGYGSQLGLFAYGRSRGVLGSIKLYLRIWVWSSLFSWYQTSSLLGLSYRHIIFPVMSICTQGLGHHYKNLMAKLTWTIQSIDVYEARITQALSGLEIRAVVLALAGIICATLPLLWYIISDPLNMGSAARSCKRAEALARQATSIEEPFDFLEWRGSETRTEGTIAFTNLLIDLDRED